MSLSYSASIKGEGEGVHKVAAAKDERFSGRLCIGQIDGESIS